MTQESIDNLKKGDVIVSNESTMRLILDRNDKTFVAQPLDERLAKNGLHTWSSKQLMHYFLTFFPLCGVNSHVTVVQYIQRKEMDPSAEEKNRERL